VSVSKLEKAFIVPHDQNGNAQEDKKGGVLFNPEQYSIEKTAQFASIAIPGLDSPIIQFIRGEAETLAMDLFFDTYTYERGKDVREYTDQVSNLLKINAEIHAPPVCSFHWGKFIFTGVIERLSKRFTMFKEDGTPVRATLGISFKQFPRPTEPKSSPDRTKRRIVREGDSLWLISVLEYGDPSNWKVIAKANNIDDPRYLRAGSEIIVPPLEK
jgi:nucleoid-associated protein YgaU